MSETLPITKERRRNVIRDVAGEGYDHTTRDTHRQDLREYEALLRQAEAALAAMTRERDAAMVFVVRWLNGRPAIEEAREIRYNLACKLYSQMYGAEMAGIAAALEALPEDIPNIADAIEAVYAHLLEAE